MAAEEGVHILKAVTEFRDLSGLISTLNVLFGATVVIAVVSLWSGLQELDLLNRIRDGQGFSEGEAEASDSRQALLGGIYFVTWVATFVLYLRWIHQSNRNARFLAGNNLHYTPGWSVGWHFVPIAGLWKPYQALKEIFQASHPDFGQDWVKAPYPSLVGLWWLLFVVSSALGQVLFRMALRAETLDEMITSSQLILVSDFIDIPLAAVGIALVAALANLQSQKRTRATVIAT